MATLAEKTKEMARRLSVTPLNPKAFVSDVYEALVARGDVADGCLEDFRAFLVAMHRRGFLALGRCDMVPAFDPIKVRASVVRHMGNEYHFIRG